MCTQGSVRSTEKRVDMMLEGTNFILGGTGMLSAQVMQKLNCPAAKWVRCQCLSFSGGRVSLDRTTLLQVKNMFFFFNVSIVGSLSQV